jgi:hypothetical protein
MEDSMMLYFIPCVVLKLNQNLIFKKNKKVVQASIDTGHNMHNAKFIVLEDVKIQFNPLIFFIFAYLVIFRFRYLCFVSTLFLLHFIL